MGLITIAINCLGGTFAVVLIRKIKDLHFSLMIFHYGYFAFAIMFAINLFEYQLYHSNKDYYPYDGLRLFHYDWTQWKILITMSTINALNLLLGFVAYQRADSGFLVMLRMMTIFYAVIYDFAVLGQEVIPGQLLGGVIIFTFNTIAIIMKYREGKVKENI